MNENAKKSFLKDLGKMSTMKIHIFKERLITRNMNCYKRNSYVYGIYKIYEKYINCCSSWSNSLSYHEIQIMPILNFLWEENDEAKSIRFVSAIAD